MPSLRELARLQRPHGEAGALRGTGVATRRARPTVDDAKAVGGAAADPKALLDVFVPGKVTNPLNGSHGHWSVRAKWAKDWRTRTRVYAEHARSAVATLLDARGKSAEAARRPKRVTFTLHVWRRFDDDALGPCAKPCRDGLVDAGVVDSDGPKAPHQWVYEQRVDRKRPGVRIVVTALEGR